MHIRIAEATCQVRFSTKPGVTSEDEKTSNLAQPLNRKFLIYQQFQSFLHQEISVCLLCWDFVRFEREDFREIRAHFFIQ